MKLLNEYWETLICITAFNTLALDINWMLHQIRKIYQHMPNNRNWKLFYDYTKTLNFVPCLAFEISSHKHCILLWFSCHSTNSHFIKLAIKVTHEHNSPIADKWVPCSINWGWPAIRHAFTSPLSSGDTIHSDTRVMLCYPLSLLPVRMLSQ